MKKPTDFGNGKLFPDVELELIPEESKQLVRDVYCSACLAREQCSRSELCMYYRHHKYFCTQLFFQTLFTFQAQLDLAVTHGVPKSDLAITTLRGEFLRVFGATLVHAFRASIAELSQEGLVYEQEQVKNVLRNFLEDTELLHTFEVVYQIKLTEESEK